MSGPGLLLGPMSGFIALLQLQSMLMSGDAVTTKSQEDRAVQSWTCPSLTATPGRTKQSCLPES